MLIIQRPIVEAIGEEENNTQRFAMGPLDPGFGHTLGNSLRRTLLSSIPGAAVTQVRFDDALHEFTTLNGVKEDVTDLILNLKDLLVSMDEDEPVIMRIDKRGPGEATAADIQARPGVEILNPELHLATLNQRGRLALDVTVERGPRLRLGRPQQAVRHHRRDPGRLDLLPGAQGHLRHRAGPGRAVDRLRPPGARDRDRRDHQPPRGAGLGRGHPAHPGLPGRRPGGRPEGARARRDRRRPRAARPTSTCGSRSWTCPSGRATASSGPRSTPSASSSTRPTTTSSASPTSARSPSTRSSSAWTSGGSRSGRRTSHARNAEARPPHGRQRRP